MNNGKVSVINQNKAKELFHDMLDTQIQFDYVQGNCHSRAHIICLLLASEGVTAAKIWAFSPFVYSFGDSTLISVTDKNNIASSGSVDWGYHVAPILYVKMGNKIEKQVFDPSLFPDGPVKYKTWLAALGTSGLAHMIVDHEWYLFNSISADPSENVSDKISVDFFKYEDFSKVNHWLEKGLAINETAYRYYKDEIKPILKNKSKRNFLKDYRTLVGDVNNFETVFRDYSFNQEVSIRFQMKHRETISKYRKIYEAELTKWQAIVASFSPVVHSRHRRSSFHIRGRYPRTVTKANFRAYTTA